MGVPSLSIIISSGMDFGMPRLAFRPIKGRMPDEFEGIEPAYLKKILSDEAKKIYEKNKA